MSAQPGRFITVEGIDGAGKSSQLEALSGWLRAHGREVVATREPGGTPLAELLREQILHAQMDALTELLLVFAARRDHLRSVIEPAIERGDIVLCDRFTDATFAYQGHGRGMALERLVQLEAWVQEGRQPDLTLCLDLPAAVAAARRAAARSPDRFERQDEAFFERVRQGYLQRAAQSPGRFVVVDALPEPRDVWRQIEHALAARPWW